MTKVKFLLFALAAVAFASCTADPTTEGGVSSVDTSSHKIVNSAMYASQGSLLINVDAETVALLDSGEGTTAIDEVAKQIGATSVEHAINMTLNAERKREYGLDRWFVVRFPEEVDVTVAAEKFAAVAAVSHVQYNTVLRKPAVKAYPVDATTIVSTRASENRFDDPLLDLQWHYINTGNQALFEGAVAGADINVDPAWDITAGRREIIVAIVDEGIDYRHPDLKYNMWVNEAELNGEAGVDDDGNGFFDDIYGYNFVPGTSGAITWDKPSVNPDREGDQGHGTHVAGTVAAVNNNGIGLCGVAGGTGNGDGVRLMSCQIFSRGILTTIDTSSAAITYAADMGATVLQNSWGYPSDGIQHDFNYRQFYGIEKRAIDYFIGTKNSSALDGGIVIFAAGNDGNDSADYPAAYVDYIGVTALAADGLPAYYTNYNTGCNIAAPGGELRLSSDGYSLVEEGGIFSTLPNEAYGYMQGTSMACPHVSGIAALALSYAMDLGITLTVDQLKSIILTSVNSIDDKLTTGSRPNPEGGRLQLNTYKGKLGTGSADAYRTLMAVRGTMCYPAVVGEEVEIDLNDIMGDGNLSLTMLKNVEIPTTVAAKLGIEDAPAVFKNKAYITCTKPGCGIIKLHAIAGGNELGGGNQKPGGMDITVEIALVVREVNDDHGWF